jgi:hypothetical protein
MYEVYEVKARLTDGKNFTTHSLTFYTTFESADRHRAELEAKFKPNLVIKEAKFFVVTHEVHE